MNFSVVIPTYNRKKDIEECLDSILRQTILPTEILVIDDGELPNEFINTFRKKSEGQRIDFIYYQKDHLKERQGSSESRNVGITIAKYPIVFILDDDVVLDNNFFEKIVDVWNKNNDKKLIGVAGIVKNYRSKGKLENFYNKVFGLTSKYAWDINPVGFQVWDNGIKQKEKGHYAHGGLCSYDRKQAQLLNFATFNGGRTALEDIDFCLRAKNKGYYFIIEPNAKAFHKGSKISREKEFLIGAKEGYNRKIIFKDNCRKSIKNYLWFYWANTGWILRQFLASHFQKGLGMIKGLIFKNK